MITEAAQFNLDFIVVVLVLFLVAPHKIHICIHLFSFVFELFVVYQRDSF